ncbi:MAG: hypothetical protein ACPG5T_02360, partial [Endozoicomonas sp.]
MFKVSFSAFTAFGFVKGYNGERQMQSWALLEIIPIEFSNSLLVPLGYCAEDLNLKPALAIVAIAMAMA